MKTPSISETCPPQIVFKEFCAAAAFKILQCQQLRLAEKRTRFQTLDSEGGSSTISHLSLSIQNMMSCSTSLKLVSQRIQQLVNYATYMVGVQDPAHLFSCAALKQRVALNRLSRQEKNSISSGMQEKEMDKIHNLSVGGRKVECILRSLFFQCNSVQMNTSVK